MQLSKLTLSGMLCIVALGVNAASFSGKMSVEYEYDRSGREITARIVNGERQEYSYDRRGQLLSVRDSKGNEVESYRYDAAGNILAKTAFGVHTEYSYDNANQLVKSVSNGVVTNFAYDAAGRMVKEGNKEYSYSGLDKVESIREDGNLIASYSYHTDGQLAQANYNGKSEKFTWDGLALMARNEVGYLNEPSVTGGNPISANGKTMFNDMLGSTLGVSNGKSFDRATMTSFGAYGSSESFYTGKPQVDGLGYTFNYRNYRSDQGKWSTADPMGYPDGFNNYAYVNNGVMSKIDFMGFWTIIPGTETKTNNHDDNGFTLGFTSTTSISAGGQLNIEIGYNGYYHNLHIPVVTCWLACERRAASDAKNFLITLDNEGAPSIAQRPTIMNPDGLTSGCIITGVNVNPGIKADLRECVVSVEYMVFSSANTLIKSDAKTALGVDFNSATLIPEVNLDLVINWEADVVNINQKGSFLFTFFVE